MCAERIIKNIIQTRWAKLQQQREQPGSSAQHAA